jgi:hypothetical protein
VADDLLGAQANLVDCMGVVEPAALEAVRLAQVVLPALLLNEDRVAEMKSLVNQRNVAANVRARNDHEHR